MAVAILAVGLTMISRSFTNCIRVMETSGDYHRALILAEQVLWDLSTKEPDEWETDGDFEDDPEFKWHQDNEEDDELKLRELDVDIRWRRRNRDYKLRIATFVSDEEI